MTIQSDFRAACIARPGLVSLVGLDGVAEGDVDDKKQLPYVVFAVQVDQRQTFTDDALKSATITAECWARKAALADQIAAEVEAAIVAYDLITPNINATLISRSSAHDGELDQDAVILSFEWWTQPV
jgi:hypothetical protein